MKVKYEIERVEKIYAMKCYIEDELLFGLEKMNLLDLECRAADINNGIGWWFEDGPGCDAYCGLRPPHPTYLARFIGEFVDADKLTTGKLVKRLVLENTGNGFGMMPVIQMTFDEAVEEYRDICNDLLYIFEQPSEVLSEYEEESEGWRLNNANGELMFIDDLQNSARTF